MSEAATPGAGRINTVVVFDQVKYDVIAGPDDATPLVQWVRKIAVQRLDIDALIKHLEHTDDLLNIAACGLAGLLHPETRQALSARLMGLQYKLRVNTGETGLALQSFGESARSMLSVLKRSLADLYYLDETDALNGLARGERVAAEMAESAGRLEAGFQGLIEEARAVLQLASETLAQPVALTPIGPIAMDSGDDMPTRLALGMASPDVGTELAAALAKTRNVTAARTTGGAVCAKEQSSPPDIQTERQNQAREIMDAMYRNAVKLAAARDKDEVEAASLVALHHSLLTLEQIAVILAERKNMLIRMAQDYAQLAQVDLRAEIEECMTKSRESRIGAYTEQAFQTHLLLVAAQWHALKLAATEFRSAIQAVYVKMGETYARNPTIEEAHRLAPVLGAALAQRIAAETGVLNKAAHLP